MKRIPARNVKECARFLVIWYSGKKWKVISQRYEVYSYAAERFVRNQQKDGYPTSFRGHIKEAQNGKDELKKLTARRSDFWEDSGALLMISAVKVLFHMPVAETERREIEKQNYACGEGGRFLGASQ